MSPVVGKDGDGVAAAVFVKAERRLVAIENGIGLNADNSLTICGVHRQRAQVEIAVAKAAPTPVDVHAVESIIAVDDIRMASIHCC